MNKRKILIYSSVGVAVLLVLLLKMTIWPSGEHSSDSGQIELSQEELPDPIPQLDKEAYDAGLRRLAHVVEDELSTEQPVEEGAETTEEVEPPLWPVDAAYPNVDAILPFSRIIAYYGNFYSKGMGVLGEYSQDVVIEKLNAELAAWDKADPLTPAIPAIDYIAVVAQAGAGKDGMYRFRMPDKEIDKAIALAEEVEGIVILEVQPGLANLQIEIEALEKYLIMPQVHLAIDPEFAMERTSSVPGKQVGYVNANDINSAAEYLASLVQEHNLPPKVMVIHRYLRSMVIQTDQMKPLPEVQIIMDMDGWGPPAQKISSYNTYIYPEPVQFTGFKLFYKNDIKREGSRLLTPDEILSLTPQPSYIQYQ